MNKVISIFFSLFLSVGLFAQITTGPSCPSIDAGSDQETCGGACVTLNASAVISGITSSYDVEDIPYEPFPFEGGEDIFVGIDDIWSDVVNLDFAFCFYGYPYDQCVIGANGLISFDLTYANAYCQWPINDPYPSPNNPVNVIAFPYHDIDPSVAFDNRVNYYVVGEAPCRILVVNFDNIPMFSCNDLLARQQVVLYETTNVIETYIENKPLCSTWNDGAAIHGLQNLDGTEAVVVPGRNFPDQWEAQNDAKRFVPNGDPTYSIQWYSGSTLVGTGPTINVCPTTTTTYTARATYETCAGLEISVEDVMQVAINDTIAATLTASATNLCAGQPVTLTATGGDSYAWSTGDTAASISASPSSTTTYTVSVSDVASGCLAVREITINVGDIQADAGDNQSICVGNTATLSASGGDNYAWSTGDNTATINVSPTETTSYTVTVSSADGLCTDTDEVTVTVNSANADAGDDQSICGTGSVTLSASGGDNYAWSNGQQGASISVSPTSTTEYTVTVTSGNCSDTDQVTVVVQAAVNVDLGPDQTVCIEDNPTLNGTTANAVSYLWNTGSTSPTISLTETGTYTLTVEGACNSSTDEIFVTVEDCYCPLTIVDLVDCTGPVAGTYIVYLSCTEGVPPYTVSGDIEGVLADENDMIISNPFAINTPYSIEVTDATGCTKTLSTTPLCGVLPVELLRFEGKMASNGNELTWVSASEMNNSHYTLQRGDKTGQIFETIATVEGSGNSNTNKNYAYFDAYTNNGLVYYRLLQTDFNGETRVVGNVVVDRKAGDNSSSVLPVSVQMLGDQLSLQFDQQAKAYYTASVYDIAGRIVAADTWLIDGAASQTMDLSRLTEGVYFVAVTDNNLSAVFKITITN